MTDDDQTLRHFLCAGDPAGDLPLERLTQLESRIVNQAAATPQGRQLVQGAANTVISWLPLPTGQSILAAVTLILLGIVVGQNIVPRSMSVSSRAPYATVAMASPWDHVLTGQGVVKP